MQGELACMLRRARLFGTLRTVTQQAPPPKGFSRQDCWRGLPFPSPRDLPDPGIEPTSPMSLPLAGECFPTVPPGQLCLKKKKKKFFFKEKCSVKHAGTIKLTSLLPLALMQENILHIQEMKTNKTVYCLKPTVTKARSWS